MSAPSFLRNLVLRLGLDKSIAYSSGARVLQAFTGVISILFIAYFLTKDEQGFYYTFGSIIATQIFFELGLTNIITQFVAHEFAHLSWNDNFTLTGNDVNLSRLASLLKFSIRWYSIIGILFLIVLAGAGIIFFSKYSPSTDDINWASPWILVCIGTVGNLFISPILAILMGLDKVKDVCKMRFYQQLIIPATSWIGFLLGFKLYVLGVSSICSVLFVIIYSYSAKFHKILVNLGQIKISSKVEYIKEIFPFQWKIAISWISGYFVLQLFNPVLFASSGAEIAGKMGMTLSVLTSISAFSQSWLNTKVPLFSRLIALKEYLQLDKVFHTTVKQMAFVCASLLILLLIVLLGLQVLDIPLRSRFLPILPFMLMAIAIYISQFVNSWAVYLRCHKKEPLLLYSIVTGLLCAVSTVILGKYWGVNGMTTGYLFIIASMSIWAHHIYRIKRMEWHNLMN